MKIKIDRDFKRNRSDKYQHLIVEASFAPDVIAEFFDSRFGFNSIITADPQYSTNNDYNDELCELQTELRAELWKIMKEVLTARQFEVIKLYSEGKTQIEIAKMLNVNQSSVTKSINGNCDYRQEKRVYGGAKKKLRKAANESIRIKELLAKIAELES